MAKRFEPVYTDEQREAMAAAYVDRGIRPARAVVELAERGELAEGLAPFKVTGGANTVRDCARKLRDRRAGRLASEAAKSNPRDAVEALRVRLLSAIDHELAEVEKAQKRRKPADPEQLRQLGRALREAAAVPTRDEARPPKPGHGPVGGEARKGGANRPGPGTLAGRILADAESGTAQGASPSDSNGGDHGLPAVALPDVDVDTGQGDGSPGAWAREQIGRVLEPDPA